MRRPQPADCPSWCTTHHAGVDEDDIREHSYEIWTLVNAQTPDRAMAAVTVVRTDNLDEGTTSETMLSVYVADCIDAAEARELALALLDGTDYLEQADQ